MKRTLKRGETYRHKDGTVYVHDSDGKVWRCNQKRREPYEDKGKPIDPVFEVSPAEFARNPSIWVATEEEKAAVKADHLERERKWWALRGKELPDNLAAFIKGGAENKMVETETPKRGRPKAVETKA